MYRVQTIDHNPSEMHLFYRNFRVLGLFFFHLVFCQEGPTVLLLRQPCLGRVALPPVGVEGGLSENRIFLFFEAFVLWWLSLMAFCVSSKGQSRSDCIQTCLRTERSQSVLQ